jgi:LuxR family maltose regulon positive regulatory protein
MPFTTGDTGKDLSFEPLTARERDVLKLLSDGLSYKEIAPALFISINTVRFHIKSIYAKLGVNSRTQAVNRARAFKML